MPVEPDEKDLAQAAQPRSDLMGVAGGKVLQALMSAIHAHGKKRGQKWRIDVRDDDSDGS